MSELLTAIPTGLTAFIATNLDDIVVLSLFFSQVNACFRRRHIVIGQYLGFSALVVASLLGIVPIIIGINRLLNQEANETENLNTSESSHWWSNFLSPQTYGVAAVTIANGSDNISIYMPMFATHTWDRLLVILLVFFVLVGVWCYTAYHLTKINAIASAITHYGNSLVPFILIGLGVSILIESQTLQNLTLLFITCIGIGSYLLILGKNIWRENYGFSLGSSEAEVIPGVKQK
jgi:cadmium resistance protein CadD (predicted permease)